MGEVVRTTTTVQGHFTGSQTLDAALRQAADFVARYPEWIPEPAGFVTVSWYGGAVGWEVYVTLRQSTSMS